MGGGSTRGVVIVGCAGAWLAGTGLQMVQPALWPPIAYGALASIALGLMGVAVRGWRRALPAWIALALLAFALAGLRAGLRLTETLPSALEGRDIVVVGVVAALPRVDAQGARFLFEPETALLAGKDVRIPPLLRIGWYREADTPAGGAIDALRAGQRWRFTLRLKQPHGLANPHGFDTELWLFEQGVRATGSVRADTRAGPLLLAHDVAAPVERLRQALRDRLESALPDARNAGVLAALAIGDQGAIDRSDWDLFRATGVTHLMSISGLHVTMFAWAAGLAVSALWRRSARAMTWLAAPVAARWGGVAAAAAYALLAGWGVPAQRTVWMLATLALLRSLGLRWPGPVMLCVVAAVVCAIDPWALLQPGFWLSFAAVALLMSHEAGSAAASAAVGWPARAARAVLGMGRTQVVATLGLAPLSMLFFQQVSLVGFVANLVAVPLVTGIVTPLALAALVVPALAVPAGWALEGLWWLLEALARWPAALWTAAAPSWPAFLLGTLGAALALLPLPWRLRGLGLLLLPPLLWPAVDRPPPGRFELVAADVGQGSAVLVRTARHLLVVDAGPRYAPESEAGSRVLLPLLRARGETAIDRLVLTHRDLDHVGGAEALMRGIEVRELLSSIEPGHPLRAIGMPNRRCDAGQAWEWDGVRFRLLHPTAADHARRAKPNALSCVVQVTDAEGRSALITGDIEREQEAALVEREGESLRSAWLIAPHHGSRTSSTAAFLAAVGPRVVVVQAGHLNRFGHPAPDVLARYADIGAAVVRSDRCGAWSLQHGEGRCTRDVQPRYWHWQAPSVGAIENTESAGAERGAEVAKLASPGGMK